MSERDCLKVTELDRRRHVVVGSIWRLTSQNVYRDSTVGAETIAREEGGRSERKKKQNRWF